MVRPNGVLENLAALMGDGICACLRLGGPVDALFSSCAFLSVVVFFGCNGRSMLRAGLAVCYGVFTPSGISLAPWVGTGRADVGVSGITSRGESKPQHPARLAKVVAVDGESDGQR